MSYVTRTPLSRSKGQGHQAALLSTVLTRKAAAAVSVGTKWHGILLRCSVFGSARRFGAHRWRRGARHIVAAARLQFVLYFSCLYCIFSCSSRNCSGLVLSSCQVTGQKDSSEETSSKSRLSPQTPECVILFAIQFAVSLPVNYMYQFNLAELICAESAVKHQATNLP